MKRFVAIAAIFVFAGGGVAVACDKENAAVRAAAPVVEGKEVVLTGYLTDSHCGKSNAHATGKACAIKCLKSGAQVQLLVEETLYTLQRVDSPEAKLGEKVIVTGILDETTRTIRVESIKPAKKA